MSEEELLAEWWEPWERVSERLWRGRRQNECEGSQMDLEEKNRELGIEDSYAGIKTDRKSLARRRTTPEGRWLRERATTRVVGVICLCL